MTQRHPHDAVAAQRLVIATRNSDKMREIGRLLTPHPWRLMSLDDAGYSGELDEPGPGYVDNALSKAAIVSATTGLTVLADDSGIEVDALRGWPGPASARWMGDSASDAERLRGRYDRFDSWVRAADHQHQASGRPNRE